ncbi:unnamed protein product [Durusdinium trenchii]|uniref:ABC transmembrane type-1 domain-containing protein n=1 Tax=Durusdinium trenchii TaxID=1381693 RepID=A0ABP0H7E1_9DINO
MAAAWQNGKIDWAKFQELIKDCPVDLLCYDPPQKKPSFAKLRQVNLFAPRTPWFRNFPCCLAESTHAAIQCSGADFRHVLISNPDTWFLEMMQPPTADMNYCPEFLRGVWWMKDNIANETCVSLESGHWNEAGTEGWKLCSVNWTTGSNWFGSLLLSWNMWKARKGIHADIQISVDQKWIALTKDDYIYVLGPEDKMVDAEGRTYPFVPGLDMLRITFPEGDPKQGLFYQYMMRKVAQKGSDGEVVKTPAYQALLERVQRPTMEGCCCNFFLCNISDDQYPSIYDSLDDHQLMVPGPEKLPEPLMEVIAKEPGWPSYK